MAMVVEQAGGRASDGHGPLMDVRPESLHERTPVYMGSAAFVDMAERFLAEDSEI
jgi:fructose-1,6-bisphosphatase I